MAGFVFVNSSKASLTFAALCLRVGKFLENGRTVKTAWIGICMTICNFAPKQTQQIG